MITQNEIKLLVCFFPKLNSLTTKEIEGRSGFSHETTFRMLKVLVGKKYLVEKKIGKTNVYDMVKDRDLMYQVFVGYMANKRLDFKEKHLLLYKRLYEFINELNLEDSAVIFGSYAKGMQTKNSDIDLLCVTNKKDIQNIVQIFRTKYNINIQPVVVKISDFKNIKKDNLQFWMDLIEYGMVLDGLDLFFKEAYLND